MRVCTRVQKVPNSFSLFSIFLENLASWGDAKCTHTKREILRNRLFCVLFNKLSYNYYRIEASDENDKDDTHELFTIRYNGATCIFPDEFLQALIDNGHTIEACPRSAITSFGIAACVKEVDGSWSNIPLSFFFRTGYENVDGTPAYFTAPHGGLDLKIDGPLVTESPPVVDHGTTSNGNTGSNRGNTPKCDIQFYVAIEGLCGWHSNHNADVPWVKSVSTTKVYTQDQALQAVRMAGLLAVTFNSVATEVRSIGSRVFVLFYFLPSHFLHRTSQVALSLLLFFFFAIHNNTTPCR